MTRRLLAWALALLPALVFARISMQDIRLPGFYYDELIQVTPALRFLRRGDFGPAWTQTSVVSIHGHPFQLMTMDYMGGVKTALLVPLLAFATASPEVVRGLSIALAATAVVATVFLARTLFGDAAAFLSAALLALDPSLILMTRVDYGPTAIMLLCKTSALLFFAIWWRNRSRLALAAGSMVAGIGLYNKADFIWVIAAGLVAVAAVAPQGLVQRIRRLPDVLLAGACFAVGCAPLLAYNAAWPPRTWVALSGNATAGDPSKGFTVALAERTDILLRLLDGKYETYGNALHANSAPFGATDGVLPLLFVATSIVVALTWMRASRISGVRDARFIVAMAWITVICAAATRGGFSGHHLVLVYPLPHIAVGWGVVALATTVRRANVPRAKILAVVLAALFAAAILTHDGSVLAHDFRELEASGGRGNFTDAIYSLDSYLETNYPRSRVVVCDWGIEFNLAVLSAGRLQTLELWPALQTSPVTDIAKSVSADSDVFVLHAPGATNFATARANFFLMAAELHQEPVRLRALSTRDGSPVLEVWRLRR
jgi:4-amino-4-deoxy-L-arabinose transferase-like glycosyltransferase